MNLYIHKNVRERSSILSKFVRNVSLYLLIIIVAVSIIDAFTTNKSDKSEITYTNFMNQVQQKKVDAVQITDDHAIVGQLKDGTSFTSYAPTDSALLPALRDADVNIIAKPPEQPSWWMNMLTAVLPILVLYHAADPGRRRPGHEFREKPCQNAWGRKNQGFVQGCCR